MKTRSIISVLFAIGLVFTSTAHAATIVTGGLTYDDTTNIITGTDGTTYLGWDQAIGLTYAETLTATEIGGAYVGYHIASQTEAYNFFNLAISGVGIAQDTVGHQMNIIGLPVVEGIFGDNFGVGYDPAFFISDEQKQVGNIIVDTVGALILLDDDWQDIATADLYSTGAFGNAGNTWLLVGDANLIATPIPAAAFMFAPALLGFFGLRRKMQA